MPFIRNQKIFSYLISLILIIFLINTIPASQPIKYIIFILINFLIFTLPYKKNFYKKKILLIRISIFFFLILIINILPLKFEMEIKSFGNVDFNNISDKAVEYYKSEYPFCYEKRENCFWIDGERNNLIYGKETQNNNNLNTEVKQKFYRNYLNIKNLNELRSNLFNSPGTTMDFENKFINNKNYPFIINLNFPKIFEDSKVCGENLNKNLECHKINKNKKSFEFINNGENYRLFIDQNIKLIILKTFFSILLLFSFYLIIIKIFFLRLKISIELLYPVSLILILIIISFSNNINFLNTYLYQYPGGDGFLYLYWSNLINQAFIENNFYNFFRGGADVFYWMPGMRYFVGIEKIIFGNAYYLHLIILSFLPYIFKRLLSIYFSEKVVIILMISFLFVPLMHHMGFSYFQFFRYFTKIFSEPIAYTIFFIGLVRLIYFYDNKNKFLQTLPLTCLIIVTSCIMRPNLTFSSFFLLIYPLYFLLKNKEYKISITYCISGSVIFLPLIHNYIYGGVFVLFTTAAFTDANIKVSLFDYYNIIKTLSIEKDTLLMLIEMLKNFINPFEIHKYLILIGLIFSLRLKFIKNQKLIPLFIVSISQFALFFFLNPGPRYMWVFWISSMIISLYFFINIKKEKIQ